VGLGAEVTIIDRSIPRLRQLDELFHGRVRTRYSTLDTIDHEISIADAVIGAVLIPGAAAPKLVTRKMLKHMKPGSVLVDVAIDQGGCFETSHPTTHADPTFVVDGIIHYCVANMPGSVPQTSAAALNNATLPYGLALADKGLEALHSHSEIGRGLLAGLNVHKGKVTSKAVAESLNLKYVEPEFALAK
jgi:alanine dehydrogenase